MSNDEKLEIVDEFISKYKDKFPSLNGDKKYYIERIRTGMYFNNNSELVDEILYATNLLERNNNPYVAFANFIEKKFGTDLNILEVCCGLYPALSIELSKRQKSGTITSYDPLLIIDKHDSIDLKKEEFKNKTDVKKYDLIIAVKPCGTSRLITQKAGIENKEFMIYPCDCYWHMNYDEYDTYNISDWHEYIYNLCISYFEKVETNYLENIRNYKNPIYTYKKILK